MELQYINLALIIIGAIICIAVLIASANHENNNRIKMQDIEKRVFGSGHRWEEGNLEYRIQQLESRCSVLESLNILTVDVLSRNLSKETTDDIELVISTDYKDAEFEDVISVEKGRLVVVLKGKTAYATFLDLSVVLKRATELKILKDKLCCVKPTKRSK
jgi:hypothetical protein